MKVRLEEPGDCDASLEVERLAFGSDQEPSIVEAVRDEEGSFALVAEEDGTLVGHVQLSRAWMGETPVLGLGPIGVVPERQRSTFGPHNPYAGMSLPDGTRVVEENLMLAPLDDGVRSRSGEIRWHPALANPPVEAPGPAP
jgi:hypothetical protein